MNQKSTPRYTLYHGKFYCHKCKAVVGTARLYEDTKDLTWMCEEKHMSKVNFNVKGY